MAWREKVAWLQLAATAGAYCAYFALVARTGRSGVDMLLLLAIAVVAQVIVMAVGAAVLAVRAGAEARAAPDERDRAIDRRSSRLAYFVLMAGMVLVGVVMPFNQAGWKISNAALFAIVVSELVRYALVVDGYRRGLHG